MHLKMISWNSCEIFFIHQIFIHIETELLLGLNRKAIILNNLRNQGLLWQPELSKCRNSANVQSSEDGKRDVEAVASDHDVNHIISSDAQYLAIIVSISNTYNKWFALFEIVLLSNYFFQLVQN